MAVIQVFRRIRQKLLSENKLGKYVFYALGEIILVVIGILIAITLNNSNQIRIAKNERDDKINKLRQIVYSDSLNLVFTVNYNAKNIVIIDSLINNLNPNMSFETYKLYSHQFARANMQYRTSIPDLSVYNELINSGEYSKINRTDLKEKITSYYVLFNHFNDLIQSFINGLYATEKTLFYNGILSHYYLSPNLSEKEMMDGYREFMATLNNPTHKRIFQNHLFELKDMHQQIVYFYDVVLNSMRGIPVNPIMDVNNNGKNNNY